MEHMHAHIPSASLPFFSPPQAGNEPPVWLEGVRRYQQSGYCRPDCPYPVMWQEGAIRCLKVTVPDVTPLAQDAPVVLLIPSLINRYYILDLTDELSLARHLCQSGSHVYIIDWAEPSAVEVAYDAGDYVTRIVLPLVVWLESQHAVPVTLMGYCIGGLLAMAAAVLNTARVARVVLLATPWDFDVHPRPDAKQQALHQMMFYVNHHTEHLFSGAYLSWLFYLADPRAFEEKYRQFSTLHTDSDGYKRFLAVEHWVNDTVPLTRAVAHTCLMDWAHHNRIAEGAWQVNGVGIVPEALQCPVLVVAPQRDRIVPPASALAMVPRLRNASVLSPDTGHIGMIIGSNRHHALWQPLTEWLCIAVSDFN
jgi:polyhydroxyalkanoate synthase subunit PhaC